MIKRLAALLCGLVFALLLVEGGLRLLAAALPKGEPVTMRPIPSAAPVVTSWPDASDGGLEVLVVGDSFTLGRGVALDEVYAARLAAVLSAEGHAVRVTSYSFPGWNSRAEAAALVRDIDRYRPDLLIVGHCLNDAERLPTARATADLPELRPWRPTGRVESTLDRYSVAYGRIRRALDTLRLRPILQDYYRNLYRDEEGRSLWRRALARIHELATERSIPAALVVFPIFDSDLDDDYAYRDLHAVVRETGRDIGFEVLDLLPAYQGVAGRELALIPFTDPHPSARAHDIAGREIARFLLERGLLDAQSP